MVSVRLCRWAQHLQGAPPRLVPERRFQGMAAAPLVRPLGAVSPYEPDGHTVADIPEQAPSACAALVSVTSTRSMLQRQEVTPRVGVRMWWPRSSAGPCVSQAPAAGARLCF